MGFRIKKTSIIGVGSLLGVFLMSCQNDELSIGDSTVGLNGGFEETEAGYPVNWSFFPNPETDRTLQVALDEKDFIEGTHSLRVSVRPSDKLPVLRSRRVQLHPGRDYRFSMSYKNDGCVLQVNRIVQGGHGKTVRRRDLIINTSASSTEWETFEETLSVAEDEGNVLFVVMIGASGTVWLDDVEVEELAG